MNLPQDLGAVKIWLSTPSPSNPPTTFKPTSTAVYAQHSRGLWQPTHSPLFILIMSTYDHTSSALSSGTVVPLVHYPTLQKAQKALAALAQQCGGREVIKDVNWGHYFRVVGANKTRSFWVKEVGHAQSLKMVDFDEVDGGLGDEWVEDGFADDETSFPGDSDENTSEAVVLVNEVASDDGGF